MGKKRPGRKKRKARGLFRLTGPMARVVMTLLEAEDEVKGPRELPAGDIANLTALPQSQVAKFIPQLIAHDWVTRVEEAYAYVAYQGDPRILRDNRGAKLLLLLVKKTGRKGDFKIVGIDEIKGWNEFKTLGIDDQLLDQLIDELAKGEYIRSSDTRIVVNRFTWYREELLIRMIAESRLRKRFEKK